ncbi:hypothetical protein BD408DRAFT_423271 [Parasitella parasitica]|nr:hypothetical protein BD408DRAFT_423271 [Parasitella parasitica]
MLSVRNLLIDTQHKEPDTRASILDISSLLNDQDDSYTKIMLPKRQQQHLSIHHHAPVSHSPRLSSIFSQPYYPIDKQQKTTRQNQLESRKIERELFAERRQSTSSLVSSFTAASYQDNEKDDFPLKPRRRRSSKQLDMLNKVFERTFFPSTQLRAELGRQLGMSPRTVQIWFQNKRQAIRSRGRSNSSK